MGNLIIAWRKAKKGKTRRADVIEFEKDIERNLLQLHYELKNKTYTPLPLTNFVLRDPKTRVISKSYFRDRIVHHAIINVIGKFFESAFIYDSCANQKNKGTLFAIKRFEKFQRKATKNFSRGAFCLKADIKHYFPEVNHSILLSIIENKIKDKDVIWLIGQIMSNTPTNAEKGKGMPLGNLISQFFANVYLNELDYFVKHELKVKYYIRYVDDFVILHSSKEQLEKWKIEISSFLQNELELKLHPDKSKIISLSKGVDFVGFRNFFYHRLLRKRNIRQINFKIKSAYKGYLDFRELIDSYKGWNAYALWANSFKLR